MLEKIEGYINRKKRKVDRKVLSMLFFLAFGLSLVFGMDLLVRFKRQKDLTEDEYNRSMYEMIGYVKNINTQLSKLEVITGDKIVITTLADIWRQSNLAKENLANLPVSQDNMGNTSKYLAQLSDYSYYLIEKVASGKKISIEEYENISKLSDYANKLFYITSKIFDDLNSGNLKWDEVENVANENLKDSENINVYSITATFQDYAGLIYDGAFSEHIMDIKPKMLEGKIISKEEAENKIKEIYGEENVEELKFISEQMSNIVLYSFSLKLKGEELVKNLYITKDTGLIYLIISDKEVKEKKITEKKAIDIGKEYLEKIGITNMIDTYYYTEENMITINFAAFENDIVMYPDLIKVKIALDTGEVCSLEMQGYIFNHAKREKNENIKTKEEALSRINNNLKINSTRMAIIPTDAKEEILCYEFNCRYGDKNYLIYINAETLEEENVLIMLDTVNGTLTM